MAHKRKQDQLYQTALSEIVDFEFDEKVAAVFPDMIERSVPGYSTTIAMTGVIAQRYARSGTSCYDLGCSVGASTLAIRNRLSRTDCRIIAVDNSESMIARCRQNIPPDTPGPAVSFICEDITTTDISNASVVVMNYTLQFIAPARRMALIQRIYQGMIPGGVLILSEKIQAGNEKVDTLMTDLHFHFKKINGYSELEIAQKRIALEKVMLPETLAIHHARLKKAGFEKISQWFQCFNFASFMVVK